MLAGFMGTGKSAVGRRLAARRGLPFIDLDAWIEERAGMSVAEIFARDGEVRFRALEKEAVREVCRGSDAVIAAGGGTVLDDDNRVAFEKAGLLLCLVARPDAIAKRVGDSVETRPLLRGHPDLIARIRDLLAQRAPAYQRIARKIDTSDLSPDQVVERIEIEIESARTAAGRGAGGASA